MTSVADFNPIAAETLECPYPFYQALHGEAPVYKVPGMNVTMVSTHELIHKVVHDPETFSSAMPTGPVDLPGGGGYEADAELEAMREEMAQPVATLLSADPPWHARYRSLVNKAFSARRVASMEDYVREIVTELIDGFIDDGKVELKSQFADQLPMSVIADQIGVPRKELAEFKRRSDLAIGGIDAQPEGELKDRLKAGLEMQRYFIERIDERREKPQDDMLTVLATAQLETDGEPRPLNNAEILSILQQFQVAGKETTADEIGMLSLLLAENPDQQERVRNNPELIPNMVEEGLRSETPVRSLFRVATKDTELGGVPVAKGETLMLVYAAANRDEAQFPEPDKFDVERENAKSHLAFSAGPHYCVGSALARLELRVAFEELLKRTKNIRLDPSYPEPVHRHSYILRGLTELHLLFDKV